MPVPVLLEPVNVTTTYSDDFTKKCNAKRDPTTGQIGWIWMAELQRREFQGVARGEFNVTPGAYEYVHNHVAQKIGS